MVNRREWSPTCWRRWGRVDNRPKNRRCKKWRRAACRFHIEATDGPLGGSHSCLFLTGPKCPGGNAKKQSALPGLVLNGFQQGDGVIDAAGGDQELFGQLDGVHPQGRRGELALAGGGCRFA